MSPYASDADILPGSRYFYLGVKGLTNSLASIKAGQSDLARKEEFQSLSQG